MAKQLDGCQPVLSSLTRMDNAIPSNPYQSQIFDPHDQQTFAASNTLCALKSSQQPAEFKSELPHYQADEGFYGHSYPSAEAYQHIAWDGTQAWMEPCLAPTPLYQPSPWNHGIDVPSTDGGSCVHYPVLPSHMTQQLEVPAKASYSMEDQQPISSPTGYHTPSLESLPDCSPSPPSPTTSSASPSPSATTSRFSTAPAPKSEYEDINDSVALTNPEVIRVEKLGDVPYAKLIHQALMETKEKRLVLKDIYKWIEDNTDKARDPEFRGWQNSVRHNLSMNGAFSKIPPSPSTDNSNKGCVWALEPSAIKYGVQSTTRYRRKNDTKRVAKRPPVSMRRQRSGRRGGYASQKYARLRTSCTSDQRQESDNLKYEAQSSPNRSGFTLRDHQYQAQDHPISGHLHQANLPTPPSSELFSFSKNASSIYDTYCYVPNESAMRLAPRSTENLSPVTLQSATFEASPSLPGTASFPFARQEYSLASMQLSS